MDNIDNTSEIQLSPEQEKIIVDLWNSCPANQPPDLKTILTAVFGQSIDGRSKEAVSVRTFLSQNKLICSLPMNKPIKSNKQLIELTDEQKEFIKSNIERMKPLELTRTLFANNNLYPTSTEFKAVYSFIKTNIFPASENQSESLKEFTPPRTFAETLNWINAALPASKTLEHNKLTEKQKKDIMALRGFLNNPRVYQYVNNFEDQNDRDIFINRFIAYCHDKHDLTEEEVDAYINLCLDIVAQFRISRQIFTLEDMQLEMANSTEGYKMSMSLADSISDARSELDRNIKRQEDARKFLTTKRSDRISAQVKHNESVLNLVGMWREESKRKEIIRLAELDKVPMQKEIETLRNMDSLRANILGISEEELLHGNYTED